MTRRRWASSLGAGLVLLAVTSCTPDEMESLWTAYGNDNDRVDSWTGGDGTYSVELPDGRVAWLFSDSYLGEVEPDGTRSSPPPLVNNSIVVQDSVDGLLGPTLLSETDGGGLAGRILSSDPCNVRYWVNDGTVEGNVLRVFVYKHQRVPACPGEDGTWEFAGVGLATLSLPDLELQSEPVLVPSAHSEARSGHIIWGVSIVEEADFTYIYGHATPASNPFVNTMYVARSQAGDITGSWDYWDGTGWSGDIEAASPLATADGDRIDVSGGVFAEDDHYVLVGKGSQFLHDTIEGSTAPTPAGPFTEPTPLYTIPEQGEPCHDDTDLNMFTYRVKPHPEYVQDDGATMVSYNVHCQGDPDQPDANWRLASLYRARFVSLQVPD